MPVEQYRVMPHHLGYKYEYYDGAVHIQPGHSLAVAAVPVEPRSVNSPLPLRSVSAADKAGLITAFALSFIDSSEYCDWSLRSFNASAKKCIRDYFAAKRGKPLDVSRLAEHRGQVVAAALVIEDREGPFLDMLFVVPDWQRKGLASALVSSVLNSLWELGREKLASSYHLANSLSAAWHREFGFVDEPDLRLAEMRRRIAQHELWRLEEIDCLSEDERTRLEAECRKWDAVIQSLEAVQEAEGYRAVTPIMRRGYP
ncbi:MAG: GNAT family N-acetyltransferase [Armatimonadota bacterium]|nr:GNAT family N-acetyltransferase [Armatimonadota bacterium]